MPHLFFLIIYYQKSLLDVYIANLITIPLGYNSEQSLSSIYELRVWSREIYNFNIFLYFAILTLIICFLVKNLKNLKHIFSNVYVLSLVLSVVIYFIGGHNYYHHLFYLVFFIPFLLTRVHNKKYALPWGNTLKYNSPLRAVGPILAALFRRSQCRMNGLEEAYT